MNSLFSLKSLGISLFCVSILCACAQKEAPAPQPPEAAYIVIQPEKVGIESELPGRLESFRMAEVRARVPGIVLERLFEEGSYVKKGQVLFRIDPRSYKASVQNSSASLSRAQANKIQADQKLNRYRSLVAINAISKQEYDDAVAAAKQAKSDVTAAKANLTNSRLDLEYATVTAPISGRIGRAMVTEGALVGQNETTLLATIQQINPIYLNLTQASGELLKIRQQLLDGKLKSGGKSSLKVTLLMEDKTEYPSKGELLFSDISVDPTTGQLAIRALFDNPQNLLLPGMFVRAKLEQAVNENAIMVPQQAVLHGTNTSTVMVINDENKVEARVIKTGAAVGNRWIVTEGLNAGDRVIVEGLQKVAPGAPVRAVPWVDPQAVSKNEDIARPEPVQSVASPAPAK